jgi:hypothetical protein
VLLSSQQASVRFDEFYSDLNDKRPLAFLQMATGSEKLFTISSDLKREDHSGEADNTCYKFDGSCRIGLGTTSPDE